MCNNKSKKTSGCIWKKNTGCIKKSRSKHSRSSQPIRRSNKRSKLHSKRSGKKPRRRRKYKIQSSVTIYVEDHYEEVDLKKFQDFVNNKKELYDIVILEEDADKSLEDHDLIPRVLSRSDNDERAKHSAMAQKDVEEKTWEEIGFDVRHLLNTAIDYALINILVNNLLYFRTGTLPEIYYLLINIFLEIYNNQQSAI